MAMAENERIVARQPIDSQHDTCRHISASALLVLELACQIGGQT